MAALAFNACKEIIVDKEFTKGQTVLAIGKDTVRVGYFYDSDSTFSNGVSLIKLGKAGKMDETTIINDTAYAGIDEGYSKNIMLGGKLYRFEAVHVFYKEPDYPYDSSTPYAHIEVSKQE